MYTGRIFNPTNNSYNDAFHAINRDRLMSQIHKYTTNAGRGTFTWNIYNRTSNRDEQSEQHDTHVKYGRTFIYMEQSRKWGNDDGTSIRQNRTENTKMFIWTVNVEHRWLNIIETKQAALSCLCLWELHSGCFLGDFFENSPHNNNNKVEWALTKYI